MFGSRVELLAPSPLTAHRAPDFLGAGAETWQAVTPGGGWGPGTLEEEGLGEESGPFASSAGKAGREGGAGAVRGSGCVLRGPWSAQSGEAPGALPPRTKAALGSWHQWDGLGLGPQEGVELTGIGPGNAGSGLWAVLPRGGACSPGIDGCVGVGQAEKLGGGHLL